MKERKEEKNLWVVKSAIGSLFKAVTLSTDPAMTLGYEASLINTSRAALIQKLEDKVPNQAMIPDCMNAILVCIIRAWKEDRKINEQEFDTIDKRITDIFQGESMMRYGLEIYRDAVFTEDLHRRWFSANNAYIQDKNSWASSNAILADVNKQLMEIIVRHDLMSFPKGEIFNMDQHGSSMGRIMKDISTEDDGVRV